MTEYELKKIDIKIDAVEKLIAFKKSKGIDHRRNALHKVHLEFCREDVHIYEKGLCFHCGTKARRQS
jgi:hypothetical protein